MTTVKSRAGPLYSVATLRSDEKEPFMKDDYQELNIDADQKDGFMKITVTKENSDAEMDMSFSKKEMSIILLME